MLAVPRLKLDQIIEVKLGTRNYKSILSYPSLVIWVDEQQMVFADNIDTSVKHGAGQDDFSWTLNEKTLYNTLCFRIYHSRK